MTKLETLAAAIKTATDGMKHDKSRSAELFALYGYGALIEQELNRIRVREALASSARAADLSAFSFSATNNGQNVVGADDLIERVLFQDEDEKFVQFIAQGAIVVSNDAGVHEAARNVLRHN